MPRIFNTAGPCRVDRHYMLPAAPRLPAVRRLIEQQHYFVLHAPRQVGKTTTLLELAHELTAEGTYAAVLLSMEAGASLRTAEQMGAAEDVILASWRQQVRERLPPPLRPPDPWPPGPPGSRISGALADWSHASPRPLVVFLDEIDALQDDVLVSVLRQLRGAYPARPEGFPWSLGLIGLRDVRDYKVKSGGSQYLHTASPFNIKAESLTLGNFSREELAALYQQHTDETSQPFLPNAIDRAFFWTRGQPWLVNALARHCTEVLVLERTRAITAIHIDQAKNAIIERQDAHLDSLAERLREPRVAAVMQAVLAGDHLPALDPDDLRYVIDLGLLVRHPQDRSLDVANPLYQEVIPRVLTAELQSSIPRTAPAWLDAQGHLDPARLLAAFLAFWKQHGEPLLKSAPYHEAAPHLVLLAFLDRVANGGGRVERKYAVGSGRMDLLIVYGSVRVAMELKVWRDLDDPDPLPNALPQLDHYLDGLGLPSGWLVIFDRRPEQPRLATRTTTETATTDTGKAVTVVRA